jgi:hypothetical protein
MTMATTFPSPEEALPRWLEELQASDRARGTLHNGRRDQLPQSQVAFHSTAGTCEWEFGV